MKVYITGRATSGSWIIRGEQLGRAIGAGIRAGADLGILVKRPDAAAMARLRGLPIVWDLVDAWPQPAGNLWDRDTTMKWLRSMVRQIKPVAMVAATRRMATDCEEFGIPVLWLPHHARPGQVINKIHHDVSFIGYEGGEQYLGVWRPILERECAARGWRFVVNPPALADLDIVVALREADGYPARNWKSNVKLANAQATGTPCVLSPEQGYIETQSGAEEWSEDPAGLTAALDRLTHYQERSKSSLTLQAAAPHLSQVAQQYRSWLDALKY